MQKPILDDDVADRAIELFLAGHEPLLFAANLGLMPEQVYDQIRWTLRLYIDKALAAQTKLNRKGKAGRKPIGERPLTNAEKVRQYRARKAAREGK